MLGAIAGDIIGSVFEWDNIKQKNFPLFTDHNFFTNDAILTLALADSILSGQLYLHNLKNYYRLYPNAGYGNSFKQWTQSDDPRPYHSWGNGAAMGISPVSYAYHDLAKVLVKAQ